MQHSARYAVAFLISFLKKMVISWLLTTVHITLPNTSERNFPEMYPSIHEDFCGREKHKNQFFNNVSFLFFSATLRKEYSHKKNGLLVTKRVGEKDECMYKLFTLFRQHQSDQSKQAHLQIPSRLGLIPFALLSLAMAGMLGLIFAAAPASQYTSMQPHVQENKTQETGWGAGNTLTVTPVYQGDGLNCHKKTNPAPKEKPVYCNGTHKTEPVIDNIGSTEIDKRYINARGQPITLGDMAALDYAAYEGQQMTQSPPTTQESVKQGRKSPYNCGPLDYGCKSREAFWSGWMDMVDWVNQGVQGTADELRTLGFMYITPDGLSYKNGVVLSAHQWSLATVDVAIGLVLIIGGYRYIANDLLGLPKTHIFQMATRLILPLIAAHSFMLFAGPIIELFNTLGGDFLNTLGGGKVLESAPNLGTALDQGIMSIIFAIINLVFMLLLSIQMAVNLALVDICLIFFPWAVIAGGSWWRLWITTFTCALVSKFLQLATVSVGTALIATIGKTTTIEVQQTLLTGQVPITSAFVAIACFYLAFKLPGMLFSSALKASVGSVHRDIVLTVLAVNSFVGMATPSTGGTSNRSPSRPSSWP